VNNTCNDLEFNIIVGIKVVLVCVFEITGIQNQCLCQLSQPSLEFDNIGLNRGVGNSNITQRG
jgi:hypothetical protein